MIEALLGSKNREQVLFYFTGRNEGYAREIAKYYNTSLSPIQNQLESLEQAGILTSKLSGRTRIYSFNPRYPFLKELRAFLEKSVSFLPEDEHERLTMVRRRPRRKDKPL